jgi:hypothetical protein
MRIHAGATTSKTPSRDANGLLLCTHRGVQTDFLLCRRQYILFLYMETYKEGIISINKSHAHEWSGLMNDIIHILALFLICRKKAKRSYILGRW